SKITFWTTREHGDAFNAAAIEARARSASLYKTPQNTAERELPVMPVMPAWGGADTRSPLESDDQVEAICRAICKVDGIDPDDDVYGDGCDVNWQRYAEAVADVLAVPAPPASAGLADIERLIVDFFETNKADVFEQDGEWFVDVDEDDASLTNLAAEIVK